MHPFPSTQGQARGARRQRGVIMVIALITLAVLLIGAAAAMRSMNVTLSSVGYFGFKRDMTNQAERALRLATTALSVNGGLGTAAARQSTNAAQNYSAVMLNSDPSGIPMVMLDTSNGDGLGGAGSGNNVVREAQDGITVHYLIDRLCLNEGAFNALTCQKRGDLINYGMAQPPLGPSPQPIYRITVRVTGPNNAFSFYQSTFTTLN